MIYPQVHFPRQAVQHVQTMVKKKAFDDTFLAVRKDGEEQARAILNGLGSIMTEDDYRTFLKKANREQVACSNQTEPKETRFRRSFANAIKITNSDTHGNFPRVRSWLPAFWRKRFVSDEDVTNEFNRVPVSFIRPFVFTMMMYLRSPMPQGTHNGDPEGEREYFVWAEPIEKQMARFLRRAPRSTSQGQNYLLFNDECRQIRSTFGLAPQAIDYMLYEFA